MAAMLCDALPRGPPPRSQAQPPLADAALGVPADRLHGGLPPPLRRRLRRPLRRLRAADVPDLRPRGDQSSLPRADPRSAAGTQHRPRADRWLQIAADPGGRRAPQPPPADAAALPRRADALLWGDDERDRRGRDRLLADEHR